MSRCLGWCVETRHHPQRRSNVTAQYSYLSWKRAEQYSCWNTQGEDVCHRLPVDYNPREYESFRYARDKWYRIADDSCKGRPVIRTTMENYLLTRAFLSRSPFRIAP